MSWGTVYLGRLTLRETVTAEGRVDASTGVRTVTITGQESNPPLTTAVVRQRAEDIQGLVGLFLPVRWTDKTHLDGYYRVTDVSVSQADWQGEVVTAGWSVQMDQVGPANAVDLEARVTAVTRSNDHGLTGTTWHAPSASAYAYYTGSSTPSGSVVRTAQDGAVTAYLGMPSGINPRWGSALSDYQLGRVRFLVDDVERVTVGLPVTGTDWELSNGLVQVTPGASATFSVAAWGGSAWEAKEWNVSVGSSGSPDLGTPDAVTLLRNDYEAATVRLVWDRSGPDRSVLDLSLRRGSRYAEGYLQTGAATTLAVWLDTAEAGTAPASAAYVSATADDADGNRYIVGSARDFTAQTTQGGLHKTATRTLDFFVGAVVGGSAAQTGDTATDLRDQYIAVLAEQTTGVKR